MNSVLPIELSAAQIAFIEGNVTIYAAAVGADLSPQVARAIGCRIDAANKRITIFLSTARAGALIAAVRAHRTLAVVFAQPGTHEAIQLKTHDANIVNLERDDPMLIANYRERMVAHISPIGFAGDMLCAFFGISISDAIALQFTPSAAFDQTPGPNAGAELTNNRVERT